MSDKRHLAEIPPANGLLVACDSIRLCHQPSILDQGSEPISDVLCEDEVREMFLHHQMVDFVLEDQIGAWYLCCLSFAHDLQKRRGYLSFASNLETACAIIE